MKKSLSYLWPLTKKIHSKYSGSLEITWLNGKKVLNSKNANYSYGSLERVLDFGLSVVQAERSAPVLVLGLGGGSVIGLLRKKFNYYGKITAVEIDPAMIDLAIEEFSIKDYESLDLVCQDAFEYVKQTPASFGLIIIDIFIDVKVPVRFYSTGFWQDIFRLMESGAHLIFNAGINSANRKETDQLLQAMRAQLDLRKLEQVQGMNTLILGTKK